MQQNSKDYEICIKEALDNAKKRIRLLDDFNKKCVLEEYKEWMNEGITQFYYLEKTLLSENNTCF